MSTKKAVKKAAPKLWGVRVKTLAELISTGWVLSGNTLKHPTKKGEAGEHTIGESDLISQLGSVVSSSSSLAKDPAIAAEKVFELGKVRLDQLGDCTVLSDGSVEMGCGDRATREEVRKVHEKLQKVFGTPKATVALKTPVAKARKRKK